MYLDVVAWSAFFGESILDVSVRHPGAATYVRHAPDVDGYANSVANTQKLARYPASGGCSVTTASIETWGRIGEPFNLWLLQMSSYAREKDRAKGIASSRYLPHWRLLLFTALAKAVSKVIEDSLIADRATPDPVLNHGQPRYPPPPQPPTRTRQTPGPSASARHSTSPGLSMPSVPLAAGLASSAAVPLAGGRPRRRRRAAAPGGSAD